MSIQATGVIISVFNYPNYRVRCDRAGEITAPFVVLTFAKFYNTFTYVEKKNTESDPTIF